MSSSRKVSLVFLIFICSILASCVTNTKADQFLIKEISNSDKSDFLFNEGLDRYKTEVLQNNDYTVIPKISEYFKEALEFNPQHPQAQQYLDELNNYKDKKFLGYKDSALKLSQNTKRSAAQDIDMIVAVKLASDLNNSDPDIQKLVASTATIKTSVIKTREDQLAALQTKMDTEKNQTELLKQMKDANQLIGELDKVDPGNKNASGAKMKLSASIDALIQKDVDSANTLITAAKFAEAEAALIHGERILTAVSQVPDAKFTTLKYQLYFNWSNSLFAAKKYVTADDRINSAIKVSRTNEATGLKAKIAKAAAEKDFDADLPDTLATIDALLAKKDAAGALDLIATTLPKLKIQSNKDKLEAKKVPAYAQIKTIYQEGISLYNEEDYLGAKQKFQTVLDGDDGYEQAQAYFDRTVTKIRALAGKD